MEHIVQFAINIDDKTIQDRIEKNAYNDIIDKLIAEIKKDLPNQGWGQGKTVNWRSMVDAIIEDFVKDHKDEIINAAADRLCEKYTRTKAYREKMAEVMEK